MSTPLTDADPAIGPSGAPAPVRSIVLCTTPGAGEDAVADALERHGAGVSRAWFDVQHVAPALLAQWDISDIDEYVAALHRERVTGGCFGVVLYWHDLRRLHRQVAGLRQPTAQRILDIVHAIAPSPVFARLRRADRPAHVAALHAREHAGATAQDLTAAERAWLGARIDATETVWTQWFDAIGVKPLDIVYEDVIDDPRAQIAVADQLVAASPVT